MKKALIAILMGTVFLISTLGPLINVFGTPASVPDDPSWYQTVQGVLDTDTYYLYPYGDGSLKVGFSKFGELIDNNTNTGLEYNGARDPFAELPGMAMDLLKLPKAVWINGWFININYNHKSWGLRNVWAGAMFSDLSDYGKPWLRVDHDLGSCTYEWEEDFRKPGVELDASGNIVNASQLLDGGRKTNGTCTTEPIAVLYHGPREFVARTVTHVFDYNSATSARLALVDVIITIIFNKVKKEVVLLKEIKLVEQAKLQLSPLQIVVSNGTSTDTVPVSYGMLVQFSDREEWDLGVKTFQGTDEYSSYGHFYTKGTASNDSISEYFNTTYDQYWTIVPTLPGNSSYQGVAINAYGPAPNASEPKGTGHYDVAQLIANDLQYVGWAAYWPCLSDWSIDAANGPSDADIVWWRAMKLSDPHYIDSYTTIEPWLAPLTVGEWDFVLSDTHKSLMGTNTRQNVTADKEFRAVAVYGVTDLNDGDDADMGYPHHNCLDEEVLFQLDEVFNPWDLSYALDKSTMRWVTKYYGNGTGTDFYLNYAYIYPVKGITDWPYVNSSDFVWALGGWDAYNTFAERVLVDGVLQVRHTDYDVSEDGNHKVYICFDTAPANGSQIKILFSTCDTPTFGPFDGSWEWLTVGRDSAVVDSAGAAMVGEWAYSTAAPVKMSGFDMQNPAATDVPYTFSEARPQYGPWREGYRDANQSYNHGRAGLMDDWSCHTNGTTNPITHQLDWVNGVPIASSNIINVGGPYASLTAEYFNDFDTVMFTMGVWTPSDISGLAMNIVPLTCWDLINSSKMPEHVYAPTYNPTTGAQMYGYGVISTYEDINGTVGLNIWGYTGQDTYYTCWSMIHSDVLAYAFSHMPHGVTSLILKFNYTLHPTDYCFVTIVEALGTISELNYQGYIGGKVNMLWPVTGATTAQPPEPYTVYWPNTWITDKFPTIHPDP